MRDLKSNMQMVVLGTVTLSGTTPGASSWVDLRGFDGATIALITQTVTDAGAAAGFTFTAQHSDLTTSASAASIVAADTSDGVISLSVTVDTDDDKAIGGVSYVGSKRYVRLNGVGTAGTDATVKIVAILGEPSQAKTTFIGTAVAAT